MLAKKLIIQIPCFNEEQNLPATLAALPRTVPGFKTVEVLVVDDGSNDGTPRVAEEFGTHHVLRLGGHKGLARAFRAGIEHALSLGADVIVNTDADNQYRAEFIPSLVQPILVGEADIVIGSRPIDQIRHFSLPKRILERAGSFVVRRLSRTTVDDAPSGFRALSREAALRLSVFGSYTYTLETLIQAGLSNLRILQVPIGVNSPTRPSRLMKSIRQYVGRGAIAILSAYLIYRPTVLFNLLGAVFLLPALALALRYGYFVAIGEGRGHVQSVIASAALAVSGVFMMAIGAIAHLQGINRRLLEEIRYAQRKESPSRPSPDSGQAATAGSPVRPNP